MRGVVGEKMVDVEAEGRDEVDNVDGASYEIENVRAGDKSKQNCFKLLFIKTFLFIVFVLNLDFYRSHSQWFSFV